MNAPEHEHESDSETERAGEVDLDAAPVEPTSSEVASALNRPALATAASPRVTAAQAIAAGTFVTALVAAGAVAVAFGGSHDGKRPPPQAASSPQRAPASGGSDKTALGGAPALHSSDAEEVDVRLIQALEGARIQVPSLTRGEGLLASHWRRMQIPWIALSPAARHVTTNIALRTSAEEKQWAMPKKDGTTWAPDARIWNMNEGSYDQRESIFAPTPAEFGFRVTVPPEARLSFGAAVVQKTREPTTFTVTVAEGDAAEREACNVQVSDVETWHDVSCDLGAFAGKNVELRLRTAGAGQETPALALWGNPTLLAKRRAEVPFNVLWVVVDALRPDVIASFHDDAADAAVRGAASPPLDALLPKVPGLTPVLDDLAKEGVRFTNASSGGAWTRPGTLSMLGGALSSQLGVDPLPWVLPDPSVKAYYESDPPLLPLLMRRAHVTTRAFVNNYFMVGYAAVGVDMGFERVDDYRYRTRDTLEITNSATRWMRENKDERFFEFVNYNSPHEPWEPPDRYLERLLPPCNSRSQGDASCGPSEDTPRKYMAEAAKDDEAIGVLLRTLGELGLRERTLVVVTADHGETLSAAHSGRSKLDDMQVRFHHAVSNYEETTRIPILLSLPGTLPKGLAVKAPVSNTDLAPTVLDLMKMAPSAKMSGKSLLPLISNASVDGDRALVSEGRGTKAIRYGHYRLLLREGGARVTKMKEDTVTVSEELFDLAVDPGERHNLASSEPARVAELRARLEAAFKNVAAADASTKVAASPAAGAAGGANSGAPSVSEVDAGLLQLRFAGGGKPRRITGTLVAKGAKLSVEPIGVARDALQSSDEKVDIALITDAEHAVGFDLKIDPPSAAGSVHWDLFMDDRPLPREHVYGGTFGLAEPALEHGFGSERARSAARASNLPEIDPSRDLGLFVARRGEGGGGADVGANGDGAPERATSGAAAAEMNRMLRDWGYANRAEAKKK